MTALFADLVSSTALSDQHDPEVVRSVVSQFFERAIAEIRRFGGSAEQFRGDAIMAMFGLQQAHEDDPERAVRAAFAVLNALAELAPEAAERHGIILQARIGIESGEVVTGDPFGGSTMATGDVLNLAARLEEHAGPGEVMVGPVVHEATASAVTYEPAGTHDIKGKAEPVAIWRAVEVRVEPGVTVRGIIGHTAPLTGRDEELQLLREAARRARTEQKAILFTILGLPGVGKSRLVRELGEELRTDDWHILRGRCLPYGEGITYWPLGEIVRDLSGITAELSSAEALERIHAAAPDDETAERLAFAIGLVPAAPVSGESVDRDIALAFRRLLEAASAERPVLLVVEDIHWAEPPLLDLLEYAATWIRDRPILIVCLARPDLYDRRPGWGSGRMEATRLQLEPLTREETSALVDALLTAGGLPPEFRQQVLDRAEGNPLFVEETVRMLLERGAIVEQDGHWVATDAVHEVAVPETIEALIRARLDALPREERSVLQGASVIGRVFQRSAVATLMDEPVETPLEQAVLRDIVTEEPADDPSYRFKHVIIRDVAYESLPKARRADLHQRTVAWLTDWAGDRRDEFVEIEAHHLEQAVLPPDRAERQGRSQACWTRRPMRSAGAPRRPPSVTTCPPSSRSPGAPWPWIRPRQTPGRRSKLSWSRRCSSAASSVGAGRSAPRWSTRPRPWVVAICAGGRSCGWGSTPRSAKGITIAAALSSCSGKRGRTSSPRGTSSTNPISCTTSASTAGWPPICPPPWRSGRRRRTSLARRGMPVARRGHGNGSFTSCSSWVAATKRSGFSSGPWSRHPS